MDYQKVIVLVVTFLPTLYESFTDRYGEDKADKLTDGIILGVASVIMTAVAYLVLKNWIAVPLFILIWRFVAFDYVTNAFLKKFSLGHKNINIFTFTGTTAFTDRITAKVNPWLRFGIRLVLFSGSVLWYLSDLHHDA